MEGVEGPTPWTTPWNTCRQPNTSASASDIRRDERIPQVRPIEEVQVGDRVAGTNPLPEQAEEVEPVPANWRKLSFRMRKDDGLLLWIDLLRPVVWIQANAIETGRTAFLELPEMGAVGAADVTYVGPCPLIKGGNGTVVTGKFTHQSDGLSLVGLRLAGQRELTGVTENHPYWSRDRKAFVKAGELRNGESVDTEFGARHVMSVEPFKYNGLLYNLETTEHVYRVASLGVLVHNGCVVGPYNMVKGHHIIAKKAFQGAAGYSMSQALSIPNSELARLGLNHAVMTTVQRQLFTKMARTGKANTLAAQARIARAALIAGGLDKGTARIVVAKAMKQLRSWGVMAPTGIPWN